MYVGSVLTNHPSLTADQAAIYAVHEGTLFELTRDVTPGVLLSWRNLGTPPNTCVAYPPTVLWAHDSSQPIRVFCTTSDGHLAVRLLDSNTRTPLSWEGHGGANAPTVFTSPGASVAWTTTYRFGCLASFLPFPPISVFRRSLFVGATDGSLWERTLIGGNLSWISHGNPTDTCVVGEPMTDPLLVPPVSPLRIFVSVASGGLFERIIDGPAGSVWVDHGRPTAPGSGAPVNTGGGGVVMADPAGGVHVFVLADATLHRLTVPALGAAGTWSALPLPPPMSATEDTWISASPASGVLVSTPATVFADFFVVTTRRRIGGGLVSVPEEEVRHCRSDLRVPGDLTYLSNLGPPGGAPLLGTNYYRINAVRGHAAGLSRVYASSQPSQGGSESLDEWTYAPAAAIGSSALGLPPALPAPCRTPGPTMDACGGPRHYTVGPGW